MSEWMKNTYKIMVFSKIREKKLGVKERNILMFSVYIIEFVSKRIVQIYMATNNV